MQSQQSLFCRNTILALFVVAALRVAAAGSTEKVLYSFASGSDGALPTSTLVADKSGNLYGTTSEGGNSTGCGYFQIFSCGVVFKLTPSAGGWTESLIYSFTTFTGGASSMGIVFELTLGSGGTWTETVLHSFTGGSDGAFPYAGLILKGNNLAGTTEQGGTGTACFVGSCGTVFALTHGKTGWREQVLYSFLGGSDGGVPFGGLVLDKADNLYGTTTQYGAAGHGAVFELKRGLGGFTESTLYSFTGGADGSYPEGGLIFDPAGNLYGTTSVGGTSSLGTVFQLKPNNGSWTLTTLHTFTGSPDGGVPEAGLVLMGNALYGTTFNGGTGSTCGPFGGMPCGTVFKLTIAEETVVYSFAGTPDAALPESSLILDKSGNLYGTGLGGGPVGFGAVFEITP
jgi:uncharacterized repeat protein (TIGR03803 family)